MTFLSVSQWQCEWRSQEAVNNFHWETDPGGFQCPWFGARRLQVYMEGRKSSLKALKLMVVHKSSTWFWGSQNLIITSLFWSEAEPYLVTLKGATSQSQSDFQIPSKQPPAPKKKMSVKVSALSRCVLWAHKKEACNSPEYFPDQGFWEAQDSLRFF